MFAQTRSSILVLFALPLLGTATAIPRDWNTPSHPSGQCNTGTLQCCNNVGTYDALGLAQLEGLLGIVVQPITGLLGLDCSPLSIIGVAGTSCTAQPVCCNGNKFGGLISVGCSPINLNL